MRLADGTFAGIDRSGIHFLGDDDKLHLHAKCLPDVARRFAGAFAQAGLPEALGVLPGDDGAELEAALAAAGLLSDWPGPIAEPWRVSSRPLADAVASGHAEVETY